MHLWPVSAAGTGKRKQAGQGGGGGGGGRRRMGGGRTGRGGGSRAGRKEGREETGTGKKKAEHGMAGRGRRRRAGRQAGMAWQAAWQRHKRAPPAAPATSLSSICLFSSQHPAALKALCYTYVYISIHNTSSSVAHCMVAMPSNILHSSMPL